MPIWTRGARRALVILAPLLLSACASMSEKQCLTANWLDQGYRDGRQGYPLARLIDHREACAAVGVTPDRLQYEKGHTQGIAEYCTPANAVVEGRNGNPYRQACPARLESRFLHYYRQGKRAYEAQERVDRLNRESRQLSQQLEDADKESTRRQLRAELRKLDRRLENARDELADYDRQLSNLW